MIELPNGNKCSEPSISPKNYKKLTSTKKDWVIQYRFYCQEFPDGYHVRLKNFNDIKDVSARRRVAQKQLENIKIELLQGYNPVIKKLILPPNHEVEPNTPLTAALWKGYDKIIGSKKSKDVMRNALKFLESVVDELGLAALPVGQVKRRHIKQILERAAEIRNFSPGNYNHHRSYLMMVFRELLELDAVDANPVNDVRKRTEVKKIRQTLTKEERIKVSKHLFEKYPTFFRYLQIFFHSGARSSELLRIQCKDVNIKEQYFKLTIIKGNKKREVNKVMKDIALPYWVDAISKGRPEDYVFSNNLQPGPDPIHPDQISKRWRRTVKGVKQKDGTIKGGIGITADFYSLKHTQADEIARLISLGAAQAHDGHTSETTTRIYAINEMERTNERLKKLGNEF